MVKRLEERRLCETSTLEHHVSENESLYLTYVKAIAAILVVAVHTKPYMAGAVLDSGLLFGEPRWMCLVDESFFYVVGTLVAGSCNALFFFCAGFLYYVKNPRYVLNLKKKAKSLLLPYLLWNSFWIIVAIFAQRANLPLSGIWRSTLDFSPSEVASWFLCFRDGYPFQGALWFLPCLFVVNMFAPAADWIMKRLPRLSLLALLALWLLFTQRVAFVSTYCVFLSICPAEHHRLSRFSTGSIANRHRPRHGSAPRPAPAQEL